MTSGQWIGGFEFIQQPCHPKGKAFFPVNFFTVGNYQLIASSSNINDQVLF
jgi:hypothetical protein